MPTDEALDLDLFVFEDECKCEAKHPESDPVCSRVVTHRLNNACEGVSKNICESAAEYVRAAHDAEGVCGTCGEPTRECWKIFPI